MAVRYQQREEESFSPYQASVYKLSSRDSDLCWTTERYFLQVVNNRVLIHRSFGTGKS